MKQLITILLILPLIFMVSCSDPGKGATITLNVSPSVLSFNTVSVGSSDTQTFTIKNSGKGELEITSMDIVLDDSDISEKLYKIDNDLDFPIIIKAGEEYTEEIRVTYTAFDVQGDNVSGKVRINSNDSNNTEKTVFLKAEKANPRLKVSVDSILFSTLAADETETLELIVSNVGTSQLKFEKFDEDGQLIGTNADAIDFGVGSSTSFTLLNKEDIRTLEPSKIEDGKEVYDSFTIRVKYIATGEGTDTGTLIIHNNSNNNGPKKIITIMANSESCELVIDPIDEFLDFGEQPVPQNPEDIAKFNITLSNAGSFVCNVKKIKVDTESSAAEFTIALPENTELPIVIEPGERFIFIVMFAPTAETNEGGAAGIINMESDDTHWTDGKKNILLSGVKKEDNSPVCSIKNLYGGEARFVVEPGQRENVGCSGNTVCSNIQMISDSYDPNPDHTEPLLHSWLVIEAPGPYKRDWLTIPNTDHTGADNKVENRYIDAYIPFATPAGSKYLIELTVTAEDGTSSVCYAEAYGLTGNSLHIELFWDVASDVDLHLLNPDNQSLSVDDISLENPSLDPDLENWRSLTNSGWWDSGQNGQDCYFSNCKGDGIEWGLPGDGDNPSLDRDDIPGTGPENINIAEPQEGWFRVSVHYYNHKGNGTDAHIRVYCNGVVAYENTATLYLKDHTWLVSDIHWKDLGDGDGECYVFSDGRIYDKRQGSGTSGYKGNLLQDIEADIE